MLEIKKIRSARENYKVLLDKRGIESDRIIDQLILLDDKRRNGQTVLDDKLSEMNSIAREIGQLFKEGKTSEANERKSRTTALKAEIRDLEEMQRILENDLRNALLDVPNVPSPNVPSGQGETDNKVISEWGAIPPLSEDALPHWELTSKYGLIDFELGVKITGAGFPVYRKQGARLQRGLINFFLDQAAENGFDEVIPPILVNEESGYGTGQLPDKEGQMYHVAGDNLYVIPTAEVPITNIYRDVILNNEELPVRNAGYTPCFRREAGSYGKDVRGLNRLHQFDKVEIVQICKPDESYGKLEDMLTYVRSLLEKLELPYRVLNLCGGDLGFAAAQTYDLEVWSAAQKRWLEVSSVSNFETFQANRLKLRFRNDEGKTELAHTLNGSALALPRVVAALLENNQSPEGIRIPKALQPYVGFSIIKAD